MPRHNARPQERDAEAGFSPSVKLPRCCKFLCLGFMDECASGLESSCQHIGLGNIGASERKRYWHGSSVSAEFIMLLDSEATLIADTEQAKRAIEGGTMVRRRF